VIGNFSYKRVGPFVEGTFLRSEANTPPKSTARVEVLGENLLLFILIRAAELEIALCGGLSP
jgi:hypothetical protein